MVEELRSDGLIPGANHRHGLRGRAESDLVEHPRQEVGDRFRRTTAALRVGDRTPFGVASGISAVSHFDMVPDVLTSARNMPERKATMLKCDFCGSEATRVRRVALDAGYDRLGQRHVVRYACEDCSREKDAARAAKVDARQKPL